MFVLLNRWRVLSVRAWGDLICPACFNVFGVIGIGEMRSRSRNNIRGGILVGF